jgi:hypothetical protein
MPHSTEPGCATGSRQATSAHSPADKVTLMNHETGERRTVARDSAEHCALHRDRRHSHLPRWIQVDVNPKEAA